MLVFLKRVIPWVIAGVLFTGGYHLGYEKADSKWKEVNRVEYVKKTEARADKQAALNKVSQDYQDKLSELEGSTDRVIADLRKSNSGLYVKLKNASGTARPNGRCELDGRAELDDSTAKDLIQITQRGDAWIEALQQTIRELQQKEKK